MSPAIFILVCGLSASQPEAPPAVPLEVAPPPRAVGPAVSVTAIPGGYRITLSRRAAGRLQDALDRTDEKQVAAGLRDLAGDKKADHPDDGTAAKLELAALLVTSQLPGFREQLRANTGPGGAELTVTGLQAPAVKFGKPRPRLERAAEAVRGAMPLLPGEARDALEAMRAVARTTPLLWKVEPRD